MVDFSKVKSRGVDLGSYSLLPEVTARGCTYKISEYQNISKF